VEHLRLLPAGERRGAVWRLRVEPPGAAVFWQGWGAEWRRWGVLKARGSREDVAVEWGFTEVDSGNLCRQINIVSIGS